MSREVNCPKCGAKEQEGVDAGDHPDYLEFTCDACGHEWGQMVEPDWGEPPDDWVPSV